MAAKQMEEIQKKLSKLNYPRSNVAAQSLLFAGMERYALLEWLFFKLLGDKSPFSQQNLHGEGVDRDEETSRIQYLAEIAKFLGITTTEDTEAIQGRGSYEDRMEMLRLIVDLVEASSIADNPEWSVDEQVTKDIQLIDSIAERQSQIFSEECKLFPADVQIQSVYPLPDISDLEKQLEDQSNRLSTLQEMVEDLASQDCQLSDSKYISHFYSLFVTAALICGVYFTGSAFIAKDYGVFSGIRFNDTQLNALSQNCQDEDLGVENFDPARYVSIIREEGLEISQPALDQATSAVHHPITVLQMRARVHKAILQK